MEVPIRIFKSTDGQLPDGVTLASIHQPGPGWFCVTPNLVAHGPYTSDSAFWLVKNWLHNFGQDKDFWQAPQGVSRETGRT